MNSLRPHPRKASCRTLLLWCLGVGFALSFSACRSDVDVPEVEGLPEVVDFNFHVKPILSDRCFACHGPDEEAREADFRLDTEEGAFAALEEGGHAIVRGKPGQSHLVRRITSEDPDVMMPPPSSNLKLTDREIVILTRWVEQGAEYKAHWSFTPPEDPDVPETENDEWPRTSIDRFVLNRLEEKGWEPAPEASKETLIRRVSFDLTGLPPTPEEVEGFVADSSADAYEKMVDRALASPHYGERMASLWLDLARYADSHGYQDDGMRTMWPWREWVIDAFNENMPYDQFVTWQLAGDLLPNPTREQRLATGFNRNHMQSQEGGIVLEEYRVEYVADRVNTFGKAFLGLTTECARCHDHKYDPIEQSEYYQLFAFFNQVNEVGNIPYSGEASPTVILPSEEAEAKLKPLQAQIDSLEKLIRINHPDYDSGFSTWLADLDAAPPLEPQGLVGHYPLDGLEEERDTTDEGEERTTWRFANEAGPSGSFRGDEDYLPETVEGHAGQALRMRGNGQLDMGEDRFYFERNEPFSLGLWVFREDSTAVSAPLMAKSGGLFNGNRGYIVEMLEDGRLMASLNHVGPDNSIAVRTRAPLPIGEWAHVALTYDGSSRTAGLRLYQDGRPMAFDVLVDNLSQSILYNVNYETGEHSSWGGAGNLWIGYMGNNQPYLKSTLVDEFTVFDRRLSPLEVAALSGQADTLSALAQTSAVARTTDQEAALRDYYVTTLDSLYRQRLDTLTALRGLENEILTAEPDVMVMRDRIEPRPSFVLDRGAYDAPTTPVEPGTPKAIGAFPDSLPQNRLGLAKWLLDPDHPLTARVVVNRAWQQFFGTGLVESLDDFGNQGALPSHPELLDHLATEFVEGGWDVKGLLKQIVMSATYRQSSVADPAKMAEDPSNTLLARGSKGRLPAEMIRDNALAASGLLVRKIGGPSVKPYQPEGLWKELATRNVTEYVPDQGDSLYRRGLYTIWKRTSPPPSMISFDAAGRNFCTVERQQTSTPLQSLVLLNDPQYVEAARVLAERTLHQGGPTSDAQIAYAFRLLTSRAPFDEELDLLRDLYAAEQATFEADPEAARDLLAVGEHPRDDQLDPAEAAAMTVVASTIMNFDEAVIKR